MTGGLTTADLARDREQAAADLEAAIAALGLAYQAYADLTQQLADRTGEDLARRLEVPIVLRMARAGLSTWLERKLAAPPGALPTLQALVAEQQQWLGLP